MLAVNTRVLHLMPRTPSLTQVRRGTHNRGSNRTLNHWFLSTQLAGPLTCCMCPNSHHLCRSLSFAGTRSACAPQHTCLRAPAHPHGPTSPRPQAGGVHRMTLRGHSAPISRVAIAPNCCDVVTISEDGSAQVGTLILSGKRERDGAEGWHVHRTEDGCAQLGTESHRAHRGSRIELSSRLHHIADPLA